MARRNAHLLLFGMVDRVPKVCYVATLFIHMHLFPLIPVRSYLILEPSRRDRHYGWPIPLCRRSVLMAWLRPVLLGALGVSALATLIAAGEVIDHKADALPLVICAAALAVSIILCPVSVLSNRAGLARAIALGTRLGMEPIDMEQILATSRQSLSRSRPP